MHPSPHSPCRTVSMPRRLLNCFCRNPPSKDFACVRSWKTRCVCLLCASPITPMVPLSEELLHGLQTSRSSLSTSSRRRHSSSAREGFFFFFFDQHSECHTLFPLLRLRAGDPSIKDISIPQIHLGVDKTTRRRYVTYEETN